MQYFNLIGAHKKHENLRSFAAALFEVFGVENGEERESGNYIDGYYFRGSRNDVKFIVASSDEAAHEDLPYWIQVSADMEGAGMLDSIVEPLVRDRALPAGFLLARIINFGKRNERRVDY
ncbi:hypothetical protein ACQUKI_21550 [Ralstonia pseudosolanacearum]